MATILGRSSRSEVHRLIRFVLTGAAGFLADFGTLVTAHSGFGWPLMVSLVMAYTIGGAVHYSLTRWWVFPAEHDTPEAGRVVRYLLLAAANAAVTTVAVPALSSLGLDYRIAKILCVVVLFSANYVITPRFVMPASGRSRRPAA